jgi:hypothetical protein
MRGAGDWWRGKDEKRGEGGKEGGSVHMYGLHDRAGFNTRVSVRTCVSAKDVHVAVLGCVNVA